MSKRIIIYFTAFGLLLGLFNIADSLLQLTGGYDTPRSMILNMPTMFANAAISSALNKLENARFRRLKERVGLPSDSKLSLTREEFASLTPEEKQTFLFKVEQYKYLARHDFIIGQKGLTRHLNSFLSFIYPIISAVAWGIIGTIIGTVVYLVRNLFPKGNKKKL